MEKIPSFTINHLTLEPGIYVSRIDRTPAGEALTTYDCRMSRPNREPALSISALHALEHLTATFLRNHPKLKDRVIYWGAMGCCTGNYLIMQGGPDIDTARLLVLEAMEWAASFEGEVPGATPRDCGNYLLMNLPEARYHARRYAEVLKDIGCPKEYPE